MPGTIRQQNAIIFMSFRKDEPMDKNRDVVVDNIVNLGPQLKVKVERESSDDVPIKRREMLLMAF